MDARQTSLFDNQALGDETEAALYRTRMHDMIARLKSTPAPWWTKDDHVMLDDGAFQRAMKYVPPEEAQALWTVFDAEMERMYAIWAADRAPPPPDPAP